MAGSASAPVLLFYSYVSVDIMSANIMSANLYVGELIELD